MTSVNYWISAGNQCPSVPIRLTILVGFDLWYVVLDLIILHGSTNFTAV